MKKYTFISGGVYLILMFLSILYCQPTMKELFGVLERTLIYSAIVLCILISLIIFVKSDYVSILGIIPNKYYLYIATLTMLMLFGKALIEVFQTQMMKGSAMFLPCILVFYAGYYLKRKFHID